MNLQVYRTNHSSYQNHLFFEQEKEKIESIPNVKYITSIGEIDNDANFVLLTNTHTIPESIPQKIIDKTALIIHPNSGHDNYKYDFVQNTNFPIILGNPIRSSAVAEYSMGCVFQHFTKIPNQLHWCSDRKWDRRLIRECNALILGFGHIGKILYKSLGPLVSNIDVYDPYHSQENNSFVHTSWSEELLKDKDIIIMAMGLNQSSINFLDHDKLKDLKSDVLIVNASRGEVIKEDDLLNFLKKNPKAQCYLDVFNQEPYSPGFMQECSNANKTSHIAGVYKNLNSAIIEYEHFIIQDFLYRFCGDQKEQFLKDYAKSILNNKGPEDFLN